MYIVHTAIRIIVTVTITVNIGVVVQTYRKQTLIHLTVIDLHFQRSINFSIIVLTSNFYIASDGSTLGNRFWFYIFTAKCKQFVGELRTK